MPTCCEAEISVYFLQCAQLQARVMGCWPPQALAQRWPLHWTGCNYIPEDLHPQSFRSYFGHNTNVWAAASRDGLKVHLQAPLSSSSLCMLRDYYVRTGNNAHQMRLQT